MKSFLESVLGYFEVPESFEGTCFVFPTKRAGIIFQDLVLQKFSSHTFWSPDILSIEEFIKANTELVAANEIDLIFELYDVYREYDPEIKLEEFYAWGKVLIKDFDEVDRYLKEGQKLYATLEELRNIDSMFHEDDEVYEVVNRFISVTRPSKSELYERFAETWNIIVQVYPAYRKRLINKGIGYMGMLYREVAQKKTAGDTYQHVYFVGFNALSRSEEELIDRLVSENRGSVFWDSGDLFYPNASDLAGKYLREYYEKWGNINNYWIREPVREQEIKIYSGSGRMGQTAAAAYLLDHEQPDWDSTAVVLADEQLLMPLLYSLPKGGNSINVTMGYMLSNHPMVNFFRNYFSVQSRISETSGTDYCPSIPLLEFIKNPFFRLIDPGFQYKAIDLIREKNWDWVPFDKLKELLVEDYHFILDKHQVGEMTNMLLIFLDLLYDRLKGPVISLEKEIIYSLKKHLSRFNDHVERYVDENTTYEFLWKLIEETMAGLRVPFSGEPVEGLQVMGFLESRVLDYKNLFILSVNEGHLPAGNNAFSYLPYGLRKAFALPTFEDRDAIYGYHFKRLIMRAEKVNVFYNADLSYDGRGERSRFILQLLHEAAAHEEITIKEFNANSSLEPLKQKDPPVIRKDRKVMNALNKYTTGQGDLFEKPNWLTPTGLVNYLNCSLRFYFQYIAGIREMEEPLLEMDARDFGVLFHQTMEMIYSDKVGEEMTNEDWKSWGTAFIREKAQAAFEKEYPGNEMANRNLFYLQVIEKLVGEILKHDSRENKLKILELESRAVNQSYRLGNESINLGGFVDRIDQVVEEGQEIVRIIDYKTGKSELNRFKGTDPEEYLEAYFTNSKYKAGFQIYMYAYLYKLYFPDKAVKAGLYGLGEIGDGILYLWGGNVLDEHFMQIFGSKLKDLLQEIFNPEISFTPVEDPKKCSFCPYTSICLRA